MNIADLLARDDVLVMTPPDKSQLLQALARHAADRLKLDVATVSQALARREALGSTGVGHGVALPHARIESVHRPFGLLAALTRPIPFGSMDDRPVDLVFLLLSPIDRPEEQVKCLACAARRFKEPNVMESIRAAKNPDTIHQIMTGAKIAS